VDLAASPPHVAHFDLRKPLPFPDGTFDAIYSSHVLEHFSPDRGATLVREMVRCLVPGGICRVVVPNLEAACREYLAQLDATASDAAERAALRHEWAVVNLVDQFVRERSGGRTRSLIVSGDIDEDYVRHTNGDELVNVVRADEAQRRAAGREGVFARFKQRLEALLFHPRRTGELHRWGYDRFSLGRLMTSSGLGFVRVTTFDSSEIPEWERYALDSDRSGHARKPGSLFMEGRRVAPARRTESA
jgi:SAM-dependent methyltransferase